MRSSAHFKQFCPKARNANTLVAKPEIDFNVIWSFKVIHFGVVEESLRDYLVQYNNCGLQCEGSQHMARSGNCHFSRPQSQLKPHL